MGISATALKLLWLAERQTLPADKNLCIEASNLIEQLFYDCEKLDDLRAALEKMADPLTLDVYGTGTQRALKIIEAMRAIARGALDKAENGVIKSKEAPMIWFWFTKFPALLYVVTYVTPETTHTRLAGYVVIPQSR